MSETTNLELKQAEKGYTFRPLEASDVFLMSKIIGAIGVNEFAACFEKDGVSTMIEKMKGDKGDRSAMLIGATVFFEIANVIFNNLPKCEADIYQMLSNVSGIKVAEIKKMGFVTFTEMVIDFVKKDEFRDFIGVVSRLFK